MTKWQTGSISPDNQQHRLMWASEWPVLLKTASYSNFMDLSREYLQNFSKEEQAQIFSKTAQDFYRIEL